MKRQFLYISFIVIAFAFSMQLSMAAFIGDNRAGRKGENKYGLNSVRRSNYTFSLSSLSNSNSIFRKYQVPIEEREFTAPVLIQRGNMTISYNLKFKVAPTDPLPKFKAPSRSSYLQ